MPLGCLHAVQNPVVCRVGLFNVSAHCGKIIGIACPVINHVDIGIVRITEPSHCKRHPVGCGGTYARKIFFIAEQTAADAAFGLCALHCRPDIRGKLSRAFAPLRERGANGRIGADRNFPCQHGQALAVRKRSAKHCGGQGFRFGYAGLAVSSGSPDIVTVGIAPAACTENRADIVPAPCGINHLARVVAVVQHGRGCLVTARHAADRCRSCHSSGIVAILHNARAPMLTRHAADVAGCSGHSAFVVASADRAIAVDRTDHAADICSARDIRFVAAVPHRSCCQLANHARDIGTAFDLAAHNQIFHRSAVDIAKEADRRIQPADNMVAAVKDSPERSRRRADCRPRIALAAKVNVDLQSHGSPLEGVPVPHGVRKCHKILIACNHRIGLLRARHHRKRNDGQHQRQSQKPRKQLFDSSFHFCFLLSKMWKSVCYAGFPRTVFRTDGKSPARAMLPSDCQNNRSPFPKKAPPPRRRRRF